MSDPLVCYLVSNNVVTSTNQYFPCGSSDISGAGAQSCCNAEDYCMENSICHYTRGGVTNGTGYYMAGCTDPTWQDPACPKQCTSEFRPDIIYDRASTEWRCCDSTEDTLNCQSPSELIVEAPDPQDLSTLLQLSTPAPSSTAATVTATITSVSTTPAKTTDAAKPTTTPPKGPASSPGGKETDEGMSAGEKAGIAIAGITLGVLLIGLFLYFRIRTPKPKNETKKHKSEESRTLPDNYKPSGAFTALSSQPNSALPSPALQSPMPQFPKGVSRRDSEFPISLHDPGTPGPKARFSYEHDIGPYEMETPAVHQRAPYERPLSAQELEGTRVRVQELDATPSEERGLGIETPVKEVQVVISDKDEDTPDRTTADKNK